jgi:hypothetical protein
MYEMQIQKNENLAKDQELCNSYDQLQKVSFFLIIRHKIYILNRQIHIQKKDCEDLKYLMETFSNEIFVRFIILKS